MPSLGRSFFIVDVPEGLLLWLEVLQSEKEIRGQTHALNPVGSCVTTNRPFQRQFSTNQTQEFYQNRTKLQPITLPHSPKSTDPY